jgi:hypothetical protein
MLPDKNNLLHNRVFQESVDAFCADSELPRSQAWQTWIPGPSKICLNQQEHAFNVAMLAGLHIPGAATW